MFEIGQAICNQSLPLLVHDDLFESIAIDGGESGAERCQDLFGNDRQLVSGQGTFARRLLASTLRTGFVYGT